MNNRTKTGIKLALLTALISGLANFLNKEVLISGVDAVSLTLVKNTLVGLGFLAILFVSFKKLPKIKLKEIWKLLTVALVGGSISFLLFFKGLSLASATTGSLIHKSLFLWVALLAFIFLGEKFKKYQLAALGLLALGLVLLSKITNFSFGRGELMMLIATLLWSLEVIFVKKFLKNTNFKILAAARMFLGSLFILGFVLLGGQTLHITDISASGWLKILVVAGFLFGYVFTWYKALSLAPANLVTSILTLALPITILGDQISARAIPTLNLFFGILLFTLAIYSLLKLNPWRKELINN